MYNVRGLERERVEYVYKLSRKEANESRPAGQNETKEFGKKFKT